MNISKELILRYYSGKCSAEERQFVEKWLESSEDEPSKYSDELISQIKEETWGRILSEKLNRERIRSGVSPELSTLDDQKSTTRKGKKVILLYRRFSRYVAVACLAIGIFFAGHLSGRQSVSYAAEIKQGKQLTDVLYIYGGHGTYGQVDGSKYRLRFEGTLRLHNTAQASKQIVCGEQEFTVEPHRTYFLSGSDQDAQFTEEMNLPDAYDVFERLDGTFSIKGIYD
ncbi:MAG: hypothetical protein AAF944_07550 [Bacteroidota bacterium]